MFSGGSIRIKISNLAFARGLKTGRNPGGCPTIKARLQQPGGAEAANLRVAEQYVGEFGKLAKDSNTLVIPGDVADLSSMVTTAMTALQKVKTSPVGTVG